MYKYLLPAILVCIPQIALPASESEEKLQLTEEQIAGFKAAEEKYKDNPAKMKILDQFKEKLGISTEPAVEEPPPPPPKHITTTEGSMDSANAAYASGDYATALEQYKAMAAQGNQEANIYVGMMYEAGMGTEADMATAQAWYKRASETPTEDYNHSKLVNDQTVKSYGSHRMSAEDVAKSDAINQEINSEIARVRGEDPTEYQTIEYSDTEIRSVTTESGPAPEYQSLENIDIRTTDHVSARQSKRKTTRIILFEPEKADMQYSRPESHTEHKHPEKNIREPELNTLEKS